jgi:hypothetical protein
MFDSTPFGSLPSQNSFEDNYIRKGSSKKRINSLHNVKQIFDSPSFGLLPSQNNFEDNHIR